MRLRINQILLLCICTFSAIQSDSQSVAYSVSYTLPYTNDQSRGAQDPFVAKYSKSSEYSVGIILNNYFNHLKSVQIRFSTHSSMLEYSLGSIIGITHNESKVNRYMVELETYLYEKKIISDIKVGLGAKYSRLIRSQTNSYSESSGTRRKLVEPPFGGPNQNKIDLLLRLNWSNIKLTENVFLMPSYIFGFGLSRDFNGTFPKSTALNHRFELVISKKIN